MIALSGRAGRDMRVLASAVLASVLTAMLAACATVPPQVRPASPEPFVGKWAGSWQSSIRTGRGGVNLTIERPTQARPEFVVYHVSLTNAVVPGFSDEAKFQNGELLVDRSALRIDFRLRGSDALEAEYHNQRTGDQGTWSLQRQKE